MMSVLTTKKSLRGGEACGRTASRTRGWLKTCSWQTDSDFISVDGCVFLGGFFFFLFTFRPGWACLNLVLLYFSLLGSPAPLGSRTRPGIYTRAASFVGLAVLAGPIPGCAAPAAPTSHPGWCYIPTTAIPLKRGGLCCNHGFPGRGGGISPGLLAI